MQIAARTGVGATTKFWAKNLASDAYDALVRNGLMPFITRSLRQMRLEYGSSPFHRLARAWHSHFFHALKKSKLPVTWTETAAEIYKKLGGQGDLLETMAGFSSPSTGFNISSSGPLREEFISYAYFFLHAFVPEAIGQCSKKPADQAVECIRKYEEPLQAALLSTLNAYFHYISGRAPATRIPTAAFVIAAVTPCPFGFLVEPMFVYGAMVGAKDELLKPLTTLTRAAGAEKCPSIKKALLRILMASGVTPADLMAKQKVSDDLVKFNFDKVLEEEAKQLEELTAVNKDSLRKEGATKDAPQVGTSAELLSVLADIYGEGSETPMEQLMESSLGERIKLMLEALETPEGVAYRQRVEAFVEGKQKEETPFSSYSLEELIKELANQITKEAKENPQGTPLRQSDAETIGEEAQKVLELVRGLHFKATP
ncbi:hypothetical protein Esti_002393 [Eimeria stiedai]